jgi:hypothetical protein
LRRHEYAQEMFPVIDPTAGYLATGGLALLFLSTSWHKWRAPGDFALVLANYRLLPPSTIPFVGRTVPALEGLTGLALLVPSTRAAAALVGCALLVSYAAAIAINLHRGRLDLDCGCGPRSERVPIAGWMVVRNVVLAATLVLLASLPWFERPLDAVDVLTLGAGIATEALLYLAIEELLGRVAPRARALRRPA